MNNFILFKRFIICWFIIFYCTIWWL